MKINRDLLRLVDRVIVVVFLIWALSIATHAVYNSRDVFDNSLRDEIRNISEACESVFGKASKKVIDE